MQLASQTFARIRDLMAAILEPSPLRDLVHEIQKAARRDPDNFFRAVDRAKADYARAVGDDLRQAITGLKNGQSAGRPL